MTNIPKKLNNNVGVKLSSTLAGQRELIREMRNKINELIDYLQAKEEIDKTWLKEMLIKDKSKPNYEEASKGECKEYRLSDCIACGKQYLVPKNVMAGAFCDECRKNNPPEQEEREQWQCDLAILMGKMVGPRKATFDDLLENFIKERFVSKEKIKRAIEDAADCAPGTRGRTLDAISKSLGLGD